MYYIFNTKMMDDDDLVALHFFLTYENDGCMIMKGPLPRSSI